MRILVMGAGALGGYFGARLQAAGHDVTYVARGAHLAALRAEGLRLESPRGDLHLPEVRAVEDPAAAPEPDIVLFTVKNYDLEAAARALAPVLPAHAMVVTCQNGVSAPDRLAAVIGAQPVVPGVARIPGEVAAPGVIRHTGVLDVLSFAETDGRLSERVAAFRDALAEAGTRPTVPENILHDLWLKFVSQSVLASMTALTRLDMGPLRRDPAARQLFFDAMQETSAVGRAVVPDLPGDIVDTAWSWVEQLPETMHASMLDDLLRGKPLENDWLSGDVVRLGREAGVPTPIHAVFHAALSPFATGAP